MILKWCACIFSCQMLLKLKGMRQFCEAVVGLVAVEQGGVRNVVAQRAVFEGEMQFSG